MPKQTHSISGYRYTRLTSGIRHNLHTGGQIQQRGRTHGSSINQTGYAKNSPTTNPFDWKYGTQLNSILQLFTQTNTKLK